MGGLKGLYDRVISLIKADTVLETYEPVNTDIIAVYDYSTASDTDDGQKIATKKYVPITSVGTGPQGSYNLANPTIDLGGIEADENGGVSSPNIQGMTWQQVVQALLAPYQSPVINSFTINNQSSTIEVGSTITSPKTFTIVYTNALNVSPNTFEISNTVSGTILTGSAVPVSGVATSPITFPPVTLTTDSSVTWTAKIKNTQNVDIPQTTSVEWVYKIYVGANINTTINESEIEALSVNTSLTKTSKRTYTFSSVYSPPQYLYFCFPNSGNFTMPAAIKLSGNDVPLATSAPYTNSQNGLNYALVSVTNSFGVSIQYRVYRTFQQLSGNGAAIIIS